MTTDPAILFDAETLERFEAARLLARKQVKGSQRAERRSLQRGASVEFAEYRPFVSGDDWRYIDWHAYARWRQLVLKLFVEEEDLHVHLLLDCSRSMNWGEPSKFDQARKILAGLAYVTLANLDRASIVPLGQVAVRALPAARGRERFTMLLRYLAACPLSESPRSLEEAVRGWLSTRPRRGTVIVIGDFFGTDRKDALRALDRLRHARHEIGCIQITDPTETNPPQPGEYELEDIETGQVRRIIVDAKSSAAFLQTRRNFQEGLTSHCRKHQIPLLEASTGTNLRDILTNVLDWR